MTSKDLSIFNSLRPFSIGFDDMFDQFESMLAEMAFLYKIIIRHITLEKQAKINMLLKLQLAGFNKDDVEVEYEDNLLTVKTKQVKRAEKKDGDEIIHRGISQRSFARSFTIADDVKVGGAELKDGLLTISCEKIVPEAKKKDLLR